MEIPLSYFCRMIKAQNKPLVKYFVLIVTVSVFLSACYTIPETGRKGLRLMPGGMITSQAVAAFAKLKKNSKLSTDTARNDRVRWMTDRIVTAAGPSANLPPASQWEVVVFEDDNMLNAFAMPGGKVGVYTGLIKLASSDDELAVVIAHEIAHLSAHHGSERASHGMLSVVGGFILGQSTKDMSDSKRNAILAAYGAGATYGVMRPFSRSHESEADYIGLMYMARARYNPRAAVTFWEKMAARKSGAPPEFLSTHPSHQTRIHDLKKSMPRAILEYERAK